MEKKDYLVKQEKRGARSGYVLKLALFALSVVCALLIFGLTQLEAGSVYKLLIVPVALGWLGGGYYLLLPLLTSRKFEANFALGRGGEQQVADQLAQLPAGYSAFWDVHFGQGGNIDFIVTGPCGVVAVEAKNYRVEAEARAGKLYLGGREVRGKESYQAFRSAMTLKDFLESKVTGKIYVTALLVFNSPLVLPGNCEQLGSVFVTATPFLNEVLANLPAYAKMKELEKINRVLTLISRRKIL
jgi:hypothetical protein